MMRRIRSPSETVPRTILRAFGFKALAEPLGLLPPLPGHIHVVDQLDVGTHTLFIGDVVSGEVLRKGKPLTYADYYEIKQGKSPKSAPTYRASAEERAEKTEEGRDMMKKYVCNVCGYVYDPAKGDPDSGVAPGTAFEDLPDGWVCPICGARKDQFSPQ